MDSITAPSLPSRLSAVNDSKPRNGVDADTICGGSLQHADDYFCPICMGLPRFPASLKCGHVGCEDCLRRLTTIPPSTADSNLPIGAAACPQCRTTFTAYDILPYQHWPLPAKTIFKTIIIQCSFPNESCDGLREDETKCKRCKVLEQCEFKGTMEQLVAHEMYECSNRFINCPNPGCFRFGRARDMAEHFPNCLLLRMNCPTCGLPVLYSKKSLHNCIADLQKSIKKFYKNSKIFRVPVKRMWLPGKPGEICQFNESDDDDSEISSSSQQPMNSTPTALGDTVARGIGNWRPASWRTPSAMTNHTITID